MVRWCLIDLACFSLISAVSRSPTMVCGSGGRLMAVAMIASKAAIMRLGGGSQLPVLLTPQFGERRTSSPAKA
jgi:hypothetical protein